MGAPESNTCTVFPNLSYGMSPTPDGRPLYRGLRYHPQRFLRWAVSHSRCVECPVVRFHACPGQKGVPHGLLVSAAWLSAALLP